MSIKTMKQALDALNTCDYDYDYEESMYKTYDSKLIDLAIEALSQAIAEAEKEVTLQEISDIGQWDTSDMAYRPNGMTVDANIINKAKWYQEGYEAGQRDEREACAKLCEEQYEYYGCDHIFAAKIRRRTESKSDFKNQMDDNWSGLI